jgi:homoprotocatechuate degradation regulator HpaR
MSPLAEKKTTEGMRDFRHSLPMELMKAREAAMARFRPMLRDHGLTEQQWRVLRALAEVETLDASELARRSFLLAPSLTRILQFLDAEQLIERHYHADDQRRLSVELTAAGRRLFLQIAPLSEDLYADIEAEFGRDKLESLYGLLADFYQALGRPNKSQE